MEHKDQQLASISRALRDIQPLISAEISDFAKVQQCINNVHRACLQRICNLKGYTGIHLEFDVTAESDCSDSLAVTADDDDILADEMGHLGTFLENIE